MPETICVFTGLRTVDPGTDADVPVGKDFSLLLPNPGLPCQINVIVNRNVDRHDIEALKGKLLEGQTSSGRGNDYLGDWMRGSLTRVRHTKTVAQRTGSVLILLEGEKRWTHEKGAGLRQPRSRITSAIAHPSQSADGRPMPHYHSLNALSPQETHTRTAET